MQNDQKVMVSYMQRCCGHQSLNSPGLRSEEQLQTQLKLRQFDIENQLSENIAKIS